MKKKTLLFYFSFTVIGLTVNAQKPVASFSTLSDTICQYACISFTDQSTNNPTSWHWSFQGASPSSSSNKNPQSICYNNVGTFDVSLVVSNSYGSDSSKVSIIVQPLVAANSGPDQNLCNVGSITMAGNAPGAGTGTWSFVSGPNSPTITSAHDPLTTVTGMIPGTYTFAWIITNGSCISSPDMMQATIWGLATNANAGSDQVLCNADTITLSGNIPSVGTGTWTLISGPNTPTITDLNNPSTFVTGIIGGSYLFEWTISNNGCGYSTDTTQVTILSPCTDTCSAYFSIKADTGQLHHYLATNLAFGVFQLRYDWSWGDGAHDTVPYPSHIYADSGFYNICLSVSDSAGCQSTYCDSSFHAMRTTNTMVYINVINPLLTIIKEEDFNQQQPNVYPNPVTNQLTINNTQFAIKNINIYNILGICCYKSELRNSQSEIDISFLPQGVYFLQAVNEQQRWVGKFVKE